MNFLATTDKASPLFSRQRMRLPQGHAHQKCFILRTVRRRLPSTTRGLKPGPPREELALCRNPSAKLAPSSEDRLVRHLGIRFRALGRTVTRRRLG
jgi:hypothetical protein